MTELTATVAETRANFSKIAGTVYATGKPVTVFRNSKPWVAIVPLSQDHIPAIDWAASEAVLPDAATGVTTLPASWNDSEDEGLYDDLV